MYQQELVIEYKKYFPQAVFLRAADDPYGAYLAGRAIHHTDPIELAEWVDARHIPERVEFAKGDMYANLPIFRVQLGGRTEGGHQTTAPTFDEILSESIS